MLTPKQKRNQQVCCSMCLILTYIYFTKSSPNEVYNKLSPEMQRSVLSELRKLKFVQENDNRFDIDLARIVAKTPRFLHKSREFFQAKRGPISDSMELNENTTKKGRYF
ncbi:hypothetical protein ILUMI_27456 [Ignelater luminosus]|uniref:Uncharacterized protein n=1 Tax=Ignelater luminosus TaxID=2038154 RepID=A0A8K0C4J7_IGNLU|nr:hypothetical protein ILUMI_27456 [Ignelater luminosus]